MAKVWLLSLFLLSSNFARASCISLFTTQVFPNKTILKTQRLNLRPLLLEDKLFFVWLMGAKGVKENNDNLDIWEAYARRNDRRANTSERYFSIWVIEHKGRKVGTINLRKLSLKYIPKDLKVKINKYLQGKGPFVGEVGYIIDPNFRGLGFATEAVERVTEFARSDLGLLLVLGETYHTNEHSRAVLNKSGYTQVRINESPSIDWFSSIDIN